jgi:alpha-glucuronidase
LSIIPTDNFAYYTQLFCRDGTIERGYGGQSIFFANNSIVDDLTRAAEYARLLASIRINAVVVNNVNANYTTLESSNIQGLGRIADVFRPYGVQLGLSLDFASPMELGGLKTYDPLNQDVIDWWQKKTDELYQAVPDMAGYLVKADSEGEPGPLTYNRTLAQGGNLFARAVKPYGGVVMFRAFVYNKLHEYIWTEGQTGFFVYEIVR